MTGDIRISAPSLKGLPSLGMEVAMTTHLHLHPHSHHPVRWFALEPPYAVDQTLLILVTLAALLLWFWNA
jgi:hypothetical protein